MPVGYAPVISSRRGASSVLPADCLPSRYAFAHSSRPSPYASLNARPNDLTITELLYLNLGHCRMRTAHEYLGLIRTE